MNPKVEKMTNPAKILVPQLIKDIVMASLKNILFQFSHFLMPLLI